MKKIALALVSATGLVSPALAQSDVPSSTASNTVRPTFTGPHVDASVGWNRGTDRNALPGSGRTRQSGVAVRASAGYDAPLGDGAIIGAEVGIGSGGRDIRTSAPGRSYRTDPGFTFDATGRLGVKPSDGLLIFGKAGYAYQRVRTTSVAGPLTVVEKNGEHGFLWGAGAELAMSPKVSLRADFDRVSFNDQYKRTRILGGISYRF